MDIEQPDLETGTTERARTVRDAGEEAFGARATKRINTLLSRAKAAEERAAAAEADRIDLMRQLNQTNAHRIGADEQVIQSRLAEADREYRLGKETGDLDRETKAQREMIALQVSLNNVAAAKTQAERVAASAAQPVSKPALSAAMQAWLDGGNDEWFNKDRSMTEASRGFHFAAEAAGIKPESPEYFAFIDKKMRAAFSDHFEDPAEADEPEEPLPVRQVVRPVVSAPAARRTTAPAAPATSKIVARLSAEEMEIAKAIGMTPQEYAANKPAK